MKIEKFEKLVSRKLIVLVCSVVFLVINKKLNLGVDEATQYKIVGLIATYIVGQGIADAGNQGKKKLTDIVNNIVSESDPSDSKNDGKKELLE